jgi:hypothetical protein
MWTCAWTSPVATWVASLVFLHRAHHTSPHTPASAMSHHTQSDSKSGTRMGCCGVETWKRAPPKDGAYPPRSTIGQTREQVQALHRLEKKSTGRIVTRCSVITHCCAHCIFFLPPPRSLAMLQISCKAPSCPPPEESTKRLDISYPY